MIECQEELKPNLISRLLIPKEEYNEDYSAEDLEKALRYQLQRLEFFQIQKEDMKQTYYLLQHYILC